MDGLIRLMASALDYELRKRHKIRLPRVELERVLEAVFTRLAIVERTLKEQAYEIEQKDPTVDGDGERSD